MLEQEVSSGLLRYGRSVGDLLTYESTQEHVLQRVQADGCGATYHSRDSHVTCQLTLELSERSLVVQNTTLHGFMEYNDKRFEIDVALGPERKSLLRSGYPGTEADPEPEMLIPFAFPEHPLQPGDEWSAVGVVALLELDRAPAEPMREIATLPVPIRCRLAERLGDGRAIVTLHSEGRFPAGDGKEYFCRASGRMEFSQPFGCMVLGELEYRVVCSDATGRIERKQVQSVRLVDRLIPEQFEGTAEADESAEPAMI